ncbi:MAG: hypothetical protein K6B75_08770 [Lachnospiraceae bacterium]|nr:hypothetical protein [Lachnospiraceae bacterium]
MKIENSSVSMAATHNYSAYSEKKKAEIIAKTSDKPAEAILELSKNDNDFVEGAKKYADQADRKKQEKADENAKKLLKRLEETKNNSENFKLSDEYDRKLQFIKKLFELLRNGKLSGKEDIKKIGNDEVLDLRTNKDACPLESFVGEGGQLNVGTNAGGTLWQKVTATSEYYSEFESMTFASKGSVTTSDGRTIEFGLEFSMSRSFMSRTDTLIAQDYILTDPFTINLDDKGVDVSGDKFLFDLDADGVKEKISFAQSGSGLLALDKNGDGVINDGNELFGAKTGDGFKELAEYDDDGNGWIDENDAIFSKLKVWTKDKDGNDVYMTLKQADVGAIYLGNVNSEFSFKDANNATNGVLRKSGVYLKESSGQAGMVGHVDLTL